MNSKTDMKLGCCLQLLKQTPFYIAGDVVNSFPVQDKIFIFKIFIFITLLMIT